jgi:hypothetical protein
MPGPKEVADRTSVEKKKSRDGSVADACGIVASNHCAPKPLILRSTLSNHMDGQTASKSIRDSA